MKFRIANSRITSISFILMFVGGLLLGGLILSFIALFLEFSFGNGDGIWYDLNIKSTAFNYLTFLAIVSIVIMLLLSRFSYVRSVTFCILASIGLIFAVEELCQLIIFIRTSLSGTSNQSRPEFERPDWKQSAIQDDVLGVKAKPNWIFKWAPVYEGLVYDSIYISIDQFSRRITPREESGGRTRYALFLGCSYTYGDGVSDDETLPYYFQKEARDYQSYNYGYLAYSPLHALAHLQKSHLEGQVPQKNGVGIYTLMSDHLDRVIPASRWVEITKGRFPYLDKASMQVKGTFDQRRRLYTTFLTHFQSTGLKEILGWGYPRYHTKEHEELLLEIIAKARDEYVKHFRNRNFYVIIFPGNPASDAITRRFREKGIKYFDYSKLLDIRDHLLGFDNAHPKAEVYRAVAHQLVFDLGVSNQP